ncbi:DNA/RNA non-specific endonuclease [uncultured Parvimonas sp.]|uniref:DNA/RNA non-specific endonuclease n=1 Tax=uncultured Parvimonas sp. TaxID=747372 RepID=UPI0028D28BC9|nr:DNA/RNA non-specific endonuclease [uncultured Parvimonas sp.]
MNNTIKINNKNLRIILTILLAIITVVAGYLYYKEISNKNKTTNNIVGLDVNNLPEYNGKPYVVINNNEPNFDKSELVPKSFEKYAELDNLKRCGTADSIIGQDIMPTSKRENISSVKPTGWKSVKYNGIEGGNLYNRCHLIGFQLAGENANKRNLITGTRYLNTKGMLPFENMVADYVKETNNHVRYRVTPIFVGNELVARGVQIEAMSIEDNGKAIKFNVYCFNVQPNIEINYKTGDSRSK